MVYTVKKLADLAGVSIRTLHYYDEIGLLSPTSVGSNGYRYYEEPAMLKLQQILFYKEVGLSLDEIKSAVNQPGYDLVGALERHRSALMDEVDRLGLLIETVDRTIQYVKGNTAMDDVNLFGGFSSEKQKQYEQEIREKYGEKAFEGVRDWASYTKEEQQAILAEGNAIYRDLVTAMDGGPGSPAVQAILTRWHRHLRYFYEPDIQRLRGLGEMYYENPDFNANFTRIHPDLPTFMRSAIRIYCDRLEKR